MEVITKMSIAILWLIRIGAGFRVAFSFFKMIYSEEESSSYRKRIRNTIKFYILAESIFQIKDIAVYYFKYGGKGGPL